MKDIKKFIYESLTDISVTDLSVEFTVTPRELILEIPVGYSESDVQIYIGDKFIPGLPADNSNLLYRWGVNKDNITDAYFEYDTYDELDKVNEHEPTFTWDSSFDTEKKEAELMCVKITNLRYIIKFDKFDIKKEDTVSITDTINKIFKSFDSSAANKYPITITYNQEKTTFVE